LLADALFCRPYGQHTAIGQNCQDHLVSAVRYPPDTENVQRTQKTFAEELPRLLRERGLSLRHLSELVGVSDSHLSRVVRGAEYKTVSADLARRVASALDLGEDFFVEAREGLVIEWVKRDRRLRDRLYDELRKRRAPRA
jgi:transcriptional regulator with XRE-family HTH domain